MVTLVNAFLISGIMPSFLNKTDITFISKIPSLVSASDFRTINLCHFAYKIISKVLANKFKTHLPELITPYQSAFVAGRSIQDIIFVAHEMFYFLKTRRKARGWQEGRSMPLK